MKKKFYQTNWFLILISLFFPLLGLILLWTCHKQKGTLLKIIISFILVLLFFGELSIRHTKTDNDKVGSTVNIENKVVENGNISEINEEENVETNSLKGNNNTTKPKFLLNMETQEIPIMNGLKTERIGTALRFLGDSYFIAESSVEEIKEFISTKIEPIENNYNYIVIDFLPSETGLIYNNGIIQYGKLQKENKDYFFAKEQDIFGTYSTYSDTDLKDLINTVKQKDK